ncbi:MAG: MarR family transcriptional regulator [Ndongobacter sp.]|nr:MarR family transcriptional regulator [Ndongobacter sp.]
MKYSKFVNSNDSVGLLFWKTSVLWQRKIKEVLQPLDLTHTQFVILAVVEELSETIDEITQKMISDFSMIDVMTVSSTIRLLEKKKYICRLASENDTRAYSISNTKIGKERLQEAVKKVEIIDNEFFFDEKQRRNNFMENMQILIDKNKIKK